MGKSIKRTAAGRDVKNMSSNKSVKSKARQSILTRGPRRLSDKHKLVAIEYFARYVMCPSKFDCIRGR